MSASRNGEGGIRRAGGNGSASVGGGTSSPRRHRVVRSQPARRGGTRLLYARLERLVSDSINGVCLDAFGYGRNYLIDIKYAVIVDVEATPARTYDEVAATKTMIKRTEERLGLKPERLAADTAYGTGKFLDWVIGTGITPHIPVWDMSKREEGILSRADFTFDRERNLYICPQGKFLRTTGTVHDGRTIIYRASTRDCGPCPLKPKCTPNMTFRKIPRDVHEDARDATRALMGTPEFAKSRNERKKVEMRFAHLKTHHGFERMRLRGLSGARDEFHLAAIVQNLKTMALRILGPPPKRTRALVASVA